MCFDLFSRNRIRRKQIYLLHFSIVRRKKEDKTRKLHANKILALISPYILYTYQITHTYHN